MSEKYQNNQNKNQTTNSNYPTANSSIDTNDQSGIIEVYSDNFIEEIKNMSSLLEEYNYIGMDTEFPGTVYLMNNYTTDFYYKTMKLNIDSLKLIQLGITLTNSKGEYPKNYPYHTWQFNLEFDLNSDKYAQNSLNLLINCGIDFNKLKKKGIKHKDFAEYLMISGLVLNPDIHWVSFHGSYDFGYLLHLLINAPLPENENDFTNELTVFFPNHYDIRILVQGNEKLQGGLNKLAQYLDILREGKTHQAGSDSLVTIDVFFKLFKNSILNQNKIHLSKNILFGLGLGKDDDETILYTKFGNGINFGNVNQNLMYMNTINYYQYQNNQMMLNINNLNMRNCERKGSNNNLISSNKVS